MKALTPISLANGLKLKNRIVKAATSETMGDVHGDPKPELLDLYQRLVAGDSGLIISGNVMVDRTARGEVGNVVVDAASNQRLLRRWAQVGEASGHHLWLQLNHPGRQSPKTVSKQPVAPSAVPLSGPNAYAFNPPRALSNEEIHQIEDRFVTAAVVAKRAGFSGVELHAAHGYLLSQFLSPAVNQRTDEYGGALGNRMRIIREIYAQTRERVGDGFSIGIKINSGDFTPHGLTARDSLRVIQQLAEDGIDLVEVSGGSYESPRMMKENDGVTFLDFAHQVKQSVSIPVMVTGGFRTARGIESAVANGEVDLVGMARPLILNPDIPHQLAAGTFTAISIPHFSTGIKALDRRVGSLVGLAYYEQEMVRLARGQTVSRPHTAWPILTRAIYDQGIGALTARRG